MAKFTISLTQETDLLPLLIQECAKWTKRSNSSRKPHLPTWPRYSDTTSESPFFKDISIPGEKRLHKAVRTAPSWLSENLKFKLLTMPVTNWSQTLAASCLCLALSLMVWPLKSKVTKPSSSVCGSGGTTSRNCARLWPDFSSRNLSNWEFFTIMKLELKFWWSMTYWFTTVLSLFYPQPNYQTNTSLIFYFRFRHQWITGSRPVQ